MSVLLGFIDTLPNTVREGIATGVVAMFEEEALLSEQPQSVWIHAYLAPRPGYQPGHRAILVCAALDHVMSRRPPSQADLLRYWGSDTSPGAKRLIAQAPMMADHWERAAALWAELRQSDLATERLREFVR